MIELTRLNCRPLAAAATHLAGHLGIAIEDTVVIVMSRKDFPPNAAALNTLSADGPPAPCRCKVAIIHGDKLICGDAAP